MKRTLRVGIVGSRFFTDYRQFSEMVESDIATLKSGLRGSLDTFFKKPVTKRQMEISTGGCPTGVDSMVRLFVNANESAAWTLKVFYAKWLAYGKFAGPERNKRLVDHVDVLIAFVSTSRKHSGSLQAYNYAKQKGKVVFRHDTPI